METDLNPFDSEEITAPFSEEWEAKRRVSAAISKLTEVLVTSSPAIDEMNRIAEQLESTAEEFAQTPRIFGRLAWIETGEHGSFGQVSHELNPLAGISNPLAPPVTTWIEGDIARGSCYCGWAYEGPPGSVHGGYVAAIFDQFLGMAQILGKGPGMTAYLHVNYHKRTPLNTRLELQARLLKREGRKTLMEAEIIADGIITASSEALFVQPRQGMDALRPEEA
jgi:hypothetical protein